MTRAHIDVIETPGLGDRSYIVHDGTVAAVIDPQRDIDRVLRRLAELSVRVSHVFETHLHNDYVTGGYALAQRLSAAYLVPGGDAVSFACVGVADGDECAVGALRIVALHTPGHTPNHMAYAVRVDDVPVAVFSGGSMLFGAVGRTDLISPARTEELTRAQYRSVRRLARELPGEVAVHPTHGFGSFCSATETAGDASTVAEERTRNIALVLDDEDEFVEQLLAGLAAYPRYYVHMAALNAAGPHEPDLSLPAPVDAAELRARVARGEWVIDLRERRAFARGHLRGTVSIELGDAFATYYGWTLPWQAPVTVIGDEQQLAEAVRQLVRIGVDSLAGAASAPLEQLADGALGSYAVKTFDDLAAAPPDPRRVVLDVRRRDEWEMGHLADAIHIPFWELAERIDEVPDGEVWVHCAGGFRAAIGASLLARAGRHTVLIDDDWSVVSKHDLPVVGAGEG